MNHVERHRLLHYAFIFGTLCNKHVKMWNSKVHNIQISTCYFKASSVNVTRRPQLFQNEISHWSSGMKCP